MIQESGFAKSCAMPSRATSKQPVFDPLSESTGPQGHLAISPSVRCDGLRLREPRSIHRRLPSVLTISEYSDEIGLSPLTVVSCVNVPAS